MTKKFAVVILVVSVVLCLTAPWWRKDRFPHVGTWVYEISGERRVQTSISFNSDGECSVFYQIDDGQHTKQNVPCHYEMSGKTAIIHYEFVFRYEKTDGSSQLISASYKDKITPLNTARTLRLDQLEGRAIYQKQEQTLAKKITQFRTPTIFLKKQ